MLSLIGLFLGFLSGLFLLVGLIPFLGWINWITSVPTSVLGLAFSHAGVTRGRLKAIGVMGEVISAAVLALAVFRLTLGHGIF